MVAKGYPRTEDAPPRRGRGAPRDHREVSTTVARGVTRSSRAPAAR